MPFYIISEVKRDMVEAERAFDFYRARPLNLNKVECPLDYPTVQQVSLENCKSCGYHIKIADKSVYCALYWL
ncbi:MAG: hypothetical protein ACP5NL_07060 [Thermoplasmata archaeon]